LAEDAPCHARWADGWGLTSARKDVTRQGLSRVRVVVGLRRPLVVVVEEECGLRDGGSRGGVVIAAVGWMARCFAEGCTTGSHSVYALAGSSAHLARRVGF
jgi:hypothetical protein